MPSEQHEQWKRDLFNHLERKLNGCIGCGIGEDPKDHLPVHKGHQCDPSPADHLDLRANAPA